MADSTTERTVDLSQETGGAFFLGELDAIPDAKQDPDARKLFVDGMVAKAKEASGLFLQYSQEEVDNICKEMVLAGIKYAPQLAAMAAEETGMGVVEDKILKNMVATEFVWDHIKNMKSVGTIEEFPKKNLIEVAEPHGVIFGLTPVTNPTSTVLFKCIIAVKTRNTIVFSPHSRAARCSELAAKIMAEAAEKAGAPIGSIQCVPSASREDTEYLFVHPQVALIDATGGTGMVKAAYSSGKPALGVGAGNTPVFIDKSADLEMAVVDILFSKTFDNGTVCASEQTVVVHAEVYDKVQKLFEHYGAQICNEEEVEKVNKATLHRGHMKPSMIGKPVQFIAEKSGLKLNPGTKLLITPLKGIGSDHPLSGEKLFPVLGLYQARDSKDGLNICLDINYYGGTGHTASIFSEDDEVINEFADKINAGRIIVNSPSSVGALGGVYNDLIPTFSFGCGSGGGNITMDNINVRHYLNIKKVAKRTTAAMWFRAPGEIYFNQHSLEHLRAVQAQSVVIITTEGNLKRGHVEKVKAQLSHVPVVQTYTDVSPEPMFSQVMRGVEAMQRMNPDTIIALGGGSALDIGKAIRFFYENPDFDWRDLRVNFLDPRKRVIEYPVSKPKTKLIAIPTTSGTGSEVTPIAVITDEETHQKLSMADYSLTPDIAIIDPNLTTSAPPRVSVDCGFDALTHAVESMVSTLASDYTDGLAMSAILSIFNYIERVFKDGEDMEARQRVHNAATIAGMAISNAFVGVNHSLSHAVGATFGISHGRANAIFLPYVIKYNASIPTKFTPSPNTKSYKADGKYAYIAEMAKLPGKTKEERINSLIKKIVDLQKACEVESCLKDLGIPEDKFLEALPMMIQIAMADPSGRSNPRGIMMEEIKELLLAAYYGKKS